MAPLAVQLKTGFLILKIILKRWGGQQVLTPQFPIDTWENVVKQGEGHSSSNQNLQNWLQTFEKDVLPNLKDRPVFVEHSIACLLILHAVEKYNLSLDSAIFVSPFLSELDRWEFNAVNSTFYKTDFDFKKLKQCMPISYAVFGDNDPYIPQEKFHEFVEKVGSSPIVVKNGGHLNATAGFTQFPLLLDLCKTRI